MAEGEYRLTPPAERDLEEIWRYTVERWSVDQAEKYFNGIVDAMQALAQGPALGRPAENIREGYRRQNVGSHVIFYKKASYGIAVIRVLHQRMDFESHFD